MKIYSHDDNSLIEYYSTDPREFDSIRPNTDGVQEYAKFHNTNYDLVAKLEEKITKHGHLNAPVQAKSGSFLIDKGGEESQVFERIEAELEGYNMMSLFSLAKIKQDPNTLEIMGA